MTVHDGRRRIIEHRSERLQAGTLYLNEIQRISDIMSEAGFGPPSFTAGGYEYDFLPDLITRSGRGPFTSFEISSNNPEVGQVRVSIERSGSFVWWSDRDSTTLTGMGTRIRELSHSSGQRRDVASALVGVTFAAFLAAILLILVVPSLAVPLSIIVIGASLLMIWLLSRADGRDGGQVHLVQRDEVLSFWARNRDIAGPAIGGVIGAIAGALITLLGTAALGLLQLPGGS